MKRSSNTTRTAVSAIAVAAFALIAACITAEAQTPPQPAPQQHQQQTPQPQQQRQKQKITLPYLAKNDFEVRASIGSYLVLQRGVDVYLCYMLDTRSDCTPAE
ncbi:MAG TPA: hypothetical protein VH206_16285 [Xanthobacteraceae bacterium]|nr:hypothetical protein [Xanthobacteraceae bacterium]